MLTCIWYPLPVYYCVKDHVIFHADCSGACINCRFGACFSDCLSAYPGFGWISGNVNAASPQRRLVTLEEGETTELSIGFSKGEPPSFVIDIRVEVQAGSASVEMSIDAL